MEAPKAVFFDRDGTLNVDTGYAHKPEELQWIPGARDIVADLTRAGWLVFVVTNQSGVARGYYTEDEVRRFHTYMNEEFAKCGGHVTAFYYCPHLVGAKVKRYDKDCDCRKPKPGMILRTLSEYHIPKDRAFMFGDGARDVEAAENAGIRGFLFPGGNLEDFVKQHLPKLEG